MSTPPPGPPGLPGIPGVQPAAADPTYAAPAYAPAPPAAGAPVGIPSGAPAAGYAAPPPPAPAAPAYTPPPPAPAAPAAYAPAPAPAAPAYPQPHAAVAPAQPAPGQPPQGGGLPGGLPGGSAYAPSNVAAQPKAPPPGFLLQGAQAKQAVIEDDARAAAAKEESGKAWRFYIPASDVNKQFPLVFLTGNLDTDGALEQQVWLEHEIKSMRPGDRPKQFPCTERFEPCPLCRAGNRPYLAFGFTVIDCTPHMIENGQRKGEVVKWKRKLFICKKKTFSQLEAIVRLTPPTLRGAHIVASRATDRDPRVGGSFIPVARYREDELAGMFGPEDIQPINLYENLTYLTAAELVQRGYASAAPVVAVPGPSADYRGAF